MPSYNIIKAELPRIPYGTRLVFGTSQGPCFKYVSGATEPFWHPVPCWTVRDLLCIPVDPGEGWELVPVRSVLKFGDEYLPDRGEWTPIGSADIGGEVIRDTWAPVRRRKQADPWTITAEIKRHEEGTGKPLSWENPLKCRTREDELVVIDRALIKHFPDCEHVARGFSGSDADERFYRRDGRLFEGRNDGGDIVGPWVEGGDQ